MELVFETGIATLRRMRGEPGFGARVISLLGILED